MSKRNQPKSNNLEAIRGYSPAQREAMHRLVELAFTTSRSGSDSYQTVSAGPGGKNMPAPITGSPVPEDPMMEVGATGLKAYMGFVHEAYNAQLNWPNVYTLYNRLRRSDPEMTIVRQAFTAMSRECSLEWELPDNPTDDEKAAQEFGYEVLDDFEGGVTELMEQITAHVPFMGWGFWEIVPGLRKKSWVPPSYSDPTVNNALYQDDDEWRSQYDDGRIGIRRFGWRDHSSFWRWDFGTNMKLKGLIQRIPPGYPPPLYREIPLERACLIRFGDTVNPEGLTPLEAVWRLERMKYGLEVVQGIGYEHAAGFLNVKRVEPGTISAADRTNAKIAARAIMTAQEGNFAYWPYGIEGEVKDVPFQAAKDLTDTIKLYGILKLQVYNMGWAAMSTTSSHGSLAAVEDASSMFLLTYNAMMSGFGDQLDDQVGRRLFGWNSGAFPNLSMRTALRSKSYPNAPTKTLGGPIRPESRRPRLTVTSVDKVIDLAKLGLFLTAIQPMLPMGEDDLKAIRKLSGFLAETLPNEAGVNPTAAGEAVPPPPPKTGAFVSVPSTAQVAHDVLKQLREFSNKDINKRSKQNERTN